MIAYENNICVYDSSQLTLLNIAEHILSQTPCILNDQISYSVSDYNGLGLLEQ